MAVHQLNGGDKHHRKCCCYRHPSVHPSPTLPTKAKQPFSACMHACMHACMYRRWNTIASLRRTAVVVAVAVQCSLYKVSLPSPHPIPRHATPITKTNPAATARLTMSKHWPYHYQQSRTWCCCCCRQPTLTHSRELQSCAALHSAVLCCAVHRGRGTVDGIASHHATPRHSAAPALVPATSVTMDQGIQAFTTCHRANTLLHRSKQACTHTCIQTNRHRTMHRCTFHACMHTCMQACSFRSKLQVSKH